MSAHIELEVLLELADLGVFQGGGTHDVDQTPAARPEKYEAPEDRNLHPSTSHVIQTFDWAGKGHRKSTLGDVDSYWENQTLALPPDQP